MKITIPQLIMLNHSASESNKKYKDGSSKNNNNKYTNKPNFNNMESSQMRNYYNEW